VADFGLTTLGASFAIDGAAENHQTACYRAPELVGPPPENGKSEYSDKVDIWSLGCILYEISRGRPPFHGEVNPLEYSQCTKLQELLSVREVEIDLYGKAGKTVQRIIQEMLAVEPFKRPSAKDVNVRFQLFGLESVNNEPKDGLKHTSASTGLRGTLSNLDS